MLESLRDRYFFQTVFFTTKAYITRFLTTAFFAFLSSCGGGTQIPSTESTAYRHGQMPAREDLPTLEINRDDLVGTLENVEHMLCDIRDDTPHIDHEQIAQLNERISERTGATSLSGHFAPIQQFEVVCDVVGITISLNGRTAGPFDVLYSETEELVGYYDIGIAAWSSTERILYSTSIMCPTSGGLRTYVNGEHVSTMGPAASIVYREETDLSNYIQEQATDFFASFGSDPNITAIILREDGTTGWYIQRRPNRSHELSNLQIE